MDDLSTRTMDVELGGVESDDDVVEGSLSQFTQAKFGTPDSTRPITAKLKLNFDYKMKDQVKLLLV